VTTWGGLFARQPRAGEVKTRLQSCLTPEQAAALYTGFVLDTAAILGACKAYHKVVAYTGEGAAEGLPKLLRDAGDFDYRPQVDGSLGERLEQPPLLDQALDLLETHQVVIGPSTDGGYYLLGLSVPMPALFSDQISWGTGSVLAQTLEAAADHSLALLPVWYDVDLPSEAAFLRAHLRALRQAGQSTGKHSLAVLDELSLPAPS
jgi:glycosyltransferase A (GT-A) superfamily protein (DUF2064 family)